MVDTYAKNDNPWGGHKWVTDFGHPTHHPASLEELKWLQSQIGDHPALVGYMIGDDQAYMTPRSMACTDYLRSLPKPQLMPWLCGWIDPANLASHANPFEDPQIYPTLYSWGQSAAAHGQSYCAAYWRFSRPCRDRGLIFWPMFNAAPPNGKEAVSDSLLRFPAYAAVAYGAEGIWYFCYNAGSLQKLGPHHTDDEARAALLPLYATAKRLNHRLAAWGPKIVGARSEGLFGTAFSGDAAAWPFPAPEATQPACGLAAPAAGKLIEALSDDLLAGVLTKPGLPPLVMVVDARLSKKSGEPPARDAVVTFAPAVSGVAILGENQETHVAGRTVTVSLEGGEGQLLGLDGDHLESLTSEAAIYAARATSAPAPAARRTLTADDLKTVRAAKLRIDEFGADEGRYDCKYVELNGTRLGKLPTKSGDSWALKVFDLHPEQLALLKPSNELRIITECDDAWKFRNVTLAVQLADGTWVPSSCDPTVWSTPGWAYSEGKHWGRDGVAGPLTAGF
jgi:hypothetical protein